MVSSLVQVVKVVMVVNQRRDYQETMAQVDWVLIIMEQKFKPLVDLLYVDLVAVVQVEEERQKKREIGEEQVEVLKLKLVAVAVWWSRSAWWCWRNKS